MFSYSTLVNTNSRTQVNYTRDGQDQFTTNADPSNIQTTYIRNGFGEVKRRTSPDSGTTDTVRDLRGLVTQMTDGRAIVTNMTYDNAGRILTKTYPAATAENVTYTYDATSATNWGKGRLTKIQSQNVIIDLAYDQRGNIKSDKRTISGIVYTATTYEYDLADRIFKINYPSGRIVTYNRDATGRINQVTTKQNATAASVTLANTIVRQPLSNLVKSFTYGNGTNDFHTFTLDYAIDVLGVYDGATTLVNRAHTRSDNLNLTNVFDNVTTANNMSLWHTPANRLQNGDGPWGTRVWYYDGVGNRTQEIATPIGGSATTDVYGYPATSNRLTQVTRGGTTTRAFTYDGAGNMLTDNRSGSTTTYTYNKRNRLAGAGSARLRQDHLGRAGVGLHLCGRL